MVDEEQAGEVVDTPPERKSRKPLVIAVSVVLLLALGIGGYVWRSRQSVPGKAGKSTPKVAQAELYLPLDPAFVVNFRDAESLRYLQVGVTLMSHDPAAIEVAKGADPVIRDALVALFSTTRTSPSSAIPPGARRCRPMRWSPCARSSGRGSAVPASTRCTSPVS